MSLTGNMVPSWMSPDSPEVKGTLGTPVSPLRCNGKDEHNFQKLDFSFPSHLLPFHPFERTANSDRVTLSTGLPKKLPFAPIAQRSCGHLNLRAWDGNYIKEWLSYKAELLVLVRATERAGYKSNRKNQKSLLNFRTRHNYFLQST